MTEDEIAALRMIGLFRCFVRHRPTRRLLSTPDWRPTPPRQ